MLIVSLIVLVMSSILIFLTRGNYGNILYADARLAIWGEEQTLAEMEAALD